VAQLNPLLVNPILFASREFDAETGLYYNRARYLDPTTGRWTTQDPLGFAAGDVNLYRYVGNTPTLLVDPSGYAWSWALVGIGTAVGAGVGAVSSAAFYTVVSTVNGNFSMSGLGGAIAGGVVGGAVTGAIVGAGAGLVTGDPSALVVGVAVAAGVGGGLAGAATGGVGAATMGGGGSFLMWIGYGWNSPNTLLGLGWGFVGLTWDRLSGFITGTGPQMQIITANNAVNFLNHPGNFQGLTLGNVIHYPLGIGPATPQGNRVPLGEHEEQHTYQGQILGPLYLPANLVGGLWSLITQGNWHDGNFMEIGPMADPPRPWPW